MIVVFGSINIDGVLTTEHLPTPGETVVGARYQELPGGKGANQAIAAARYGAEVAMVGLVGRDGHGELALQALRDAKVDVTRVGAGDLPTGYASVWVDDAGNNQIVVASGANFAVEAAQLLNFEFTPHTTLLLQLEIPLAAIDDVADRAHRAGARVILNAAPYRALPRALLSKIDILLVNQTEARDLAADLSAAGSRQPNAHQAARMLAAEMNLTVVLTLGADGSLAFTRPVASSARERTSTADGAALVSYHVPALPVQTIDTTGAGDTYAGCLAAALDHGESLETALRVASVGSALACQHLGAQGGMPTRDTVLQQLGNLTPTRIG